MSEEAKLVPIPMYSYGGFKVCELCAPPDPEAKVVPVEKVEDDTPPKIKINFKGPRRARVGGRLNIEGGKKQ